MNIKIEEMIVKSNKSKKDTSFLIKIINNLLEKYKDMQVETDKILSTVYFILKEDDFSATIGYNTITKSLEFEIRNAENLNFNFEDDLKKEFEGVL